MLIIEEKISFFERYNTILNESLRPEIIYLDEKLIWKRFLKNFGLNNFKLRYLKNYTPEILNNLKNDEIYQAIVKSCGNLIKEML